jgi:hypothetical protein
MKYQTPEEYKRMRSNIITMVLATDMARHFTDISKFKGRVTAEDFDPKGGDKVLSMCIILHLADINHAGKEWELCFKWTDLLFIEFFKQVRIN